MDNLNDLAKWLFSFAILAAVIYWCQFSVNTVLRALEFKTDADILAVAGVATIAGGLMTLLTLVVQYWFRKAKTQEK